MGLKGGSHPCFDFGAFLQVIGRGGGGDVAEGKDFDYFCGFRFCFRVDVGVGCWFASV